jgi:hypothetical protein
MIDAEPRQFVCGAPLLDPTTPPERKNDVAGMPDLL